MLTRRAFLGALTATASGLVVPTTGLVVPERRVWALGRWSEPDDPALIARGVWPHVAAAVERVIENQRRRREWTKSFSDAMLFQATITLGVENGAWRVVAPEQAAGLT